MANLINDDDIGESIRVILSKDEKGRNFLKDISRQKSEIEERNQKNALLELKSNLNPDIKIGDQELLQILLKHNLDVVDSAMEVVQIVNVATLLQMFGKEFTKEAIQKVLDAHYGDLDSACEQLARDLHKKQQKNQPEKHSQQKTKTR